MKTMAVVLSWAVMQACALAGPVSFDLGKVANKDGVYESGGAGKAAALGGNPAALHALGETGNMAGLPGDRRVASAAPELGMYVLLPYNGPNCFEMCSSASAPPQSGLVDVPDRAYEKIGLLVTSVDGDSSFTLKLFYSDGQVDTLWFEADDWYDLGPRGNLAKAVRDMDRVEVASGAIEKAGHFNLYEFIVDSERGLKTDKTLTSIEIGNQPNRWPDGELRYGVVFAVNGATAEAAPKAAQP